MKEKKEQFKPESLMMSYGYNPQWSEGAIKCPLFQTSTFVFKTAEEGKAFFEIAYGIREQREKEKLGLIYSRLNNPDLEILEDRLTLWDGAEDAAVFESGMSAITTSLLEFLKPGDVFLYSTPVYGGTHHFMAEVLPKYGIHGFPFRSGQEKHELEKIIEASGKSDSLRAIFIETPGNPTNDLVDISYCRAFADRYSKQENPVIVIVDNTYLGPVFQHPLQHGADLVVYSATKYIGGHSDVIAGAVLGSCELIGRIKEFRTFLGNMAGPWTGWLLMRSLETLKIRMERQSKNARQVAEFLKTHPKIESVQYLGFIDELHPEQKEVYEKQCLAPGGMLSFLIKGGEAEAFAFLNALTLIKLAVSLGGTESLAEHPASMTHAGIDIETRQSIGIFENMVRLSVGVEHPEDLIFDITQALEHV
jgi:methionine-gamma-lyase